METPTYIALSRQMVLREQMEVVANNLANANTQGFKAEMMLMSEVELPAEKGTKLSYVQDFATARDFSPGTLRPTGNDLDLAIQGNGFFAVQTPEGVRYTRVGRFQLDGDGILVTSHGYPVLAGGGRVTIDPDDGPVNVGRGRQHLHRPGPERPDAAGDRQARRRRFRQPRGPGARPGQPVRRRQPRRRPRPPARSRSACWKIRTSTRSWR